MFKISVRESSNCSKMFSFIDENYIYLIDAFDYEADDFIDCELKVTDLSGNLQTATEKFVVRILDENDNLPEFDEEIYDFEIFENIPTGQLIGSVHSCDRDTIGEIFYRLEDNSPLEIDLKSGTLKTQTNLDFELGF